LVGGYWSACKGGARSDCRPVRVRILPLGPLERFHRERDACPSG
jgi:hypothetical protein